MLCPKVWNFKAPKHQLNIINTCSKKAEINTTIKNHYNNHSVSVVIPNSKNIPEVLIDSILEDSDYYKVEGVNASQLVNKEFIEAFVKKGELSLLSINVKIDIDNVITITPNGLLILSLNIEDFQTLGIEGKLSYFDRNKQTRYVVEINLNEETFTPGKKNYERVRSCLENNLKQKFDVILSWDPPEEKLCPSSVASWFYNQGNNVTLCHQKSTKLIHYSLDVPTLEDNYKAEDIFEWIGILSIDGDLKNKDTENYVNSYICPKPNTPVNQVFYFECTGYFSRLKINKIYELIKKFNSTDNDLQSPWISLHIQGFADSPVSWSSNEHNYYTDGDNSLTIIFHSNGNAIVQKSLSSNSKPRIFQ